MSLFEWYVSRKSEPFIARTEKLLYGDGLGDGGALHKIHMKVNRAKKMLSKFRSKDVASKLLLVAKSGI